jgi:hypothetical protein
LERKEEMSDGNREDTTVSVQIEEIKCSIRALPFVTKLSPVRAHKGHGPGWGVSMRCSACEEYDSCGKKQEPPVTVRLYSPWKTTMTSGRDVSEYLDTLGLVKSYFFKKFFFEKKN